MIDDYEEIETPQLLDILKEAWFKGIKIWIATRSSRKNMLENYFGTTSMKIQHLTPQEQIYFFEKYFSNTNVSDVNEVLTNIDAIRNKMDETFIGVLQQMVMLAEIGDKQPELLTRDFKIIDLYETLIDIKMLFFKEHFRQAFKNVLQKLAMSYIFSKDMLENIFDTFELAAFTECFKVENTKGAIVTSINAKNYPIFSHKTYAEYLAAKWLADNISRRFRTDRERLRIAIEGLFSLELRTVRYFFDCILTEDLPILQAAVNNDYELMETLYSDNASLIGSRDTLGRTLHHFLIGNFPQYVVDTKHDKIVRNKIDESASVKYSKKIIFVEVSRRTDSNPLKNERYSLWFDRLSPLFGDNYKNIVAKYFGWNLIEFVLYVGSLSLLDYILGLETVTLPKLSETQLYLISTQCTMNKFNHILEQIPFDKIYVENIRVSILMQLLWIM